jgi:sarcosine oxidase subunit alpha
MVKDGDKRIGETLWISQKDGDPIPVRVTETDFIALAEKGGIGETSMTGADSDG